MRTRLSVYIRAAVAVLSLSLPVAADASLPNAGIAVVSLPNGSVLSPPSPAVALGVVLANDGRVLCPLSALDGRESVVLRYASGEKDSARVVQKDPTLDLALLRPLRMAWKTGLPAGATPISDPGVRAWVLADGHFQKLALTLGAVRPEEIGGPLVPVEVTAAPASATIVGAPVINSSGSVVAVLTHPCPAGQIVCHAPFQAASTVTLRHFLMQGVTPAQAPAASATPSSATPEPAPTATSTTSTPNPTPHSNAAPITPPATPESARQPVWLGIRAEAEPAAHGIRVLAVAPSSPAETAGLHAQTTSDPGDLVLAIDGTHVTSPDDLSKAIAAHTVGDVILLSVKTKNKPRTVVVRLEAAPH